MKLIFDDNHLQISQIFFRPTTIKWFLNDDLHREDGPSIFNISGYCTWHKNGELHREDGPAISYADGDQFWYYNGRLHREGGPAIIHTDGKQHWYEHGVNLHVRK